MPTVNVRNFDGTDDVIRVTAPAYFSGAYTWAAVLKRDSGTAFHSPITIGGAGTGAPYFVVTFSNDNASMNIRHGGGAATWDDYAADNTDLHLIVITRSGSGATPRLHVFEDGAWTHSDPNSNSTADPADWTAESDEEMRFGNWNSSFNWFDGVMVVQALNPGTGLSDGQVEALAGGDRDDYATAGFDHLWEFNQASTGTAVTDYIGDLDQIGITGTSVTTLDVPSTVYSFDAGGGASGGGGANIRPGRHRGRWPAREPAWF